MDFEQFKPYTINILDLLIHNVLLGINDGLIDHQDSLVGRYRTWKPAFLLQRDHGSMIPITPAAAPGWEVDTAWKLPMMPSSNAPNRQVDQAHHQALMDSLQARSHLARGNGNIPDQQALYREAVALAYLWTA